MASFCFFSPWAPSNNPCDTLNRFTLKEDVTDRTEILEALVLGLPFCAYLSKAFSKDDFARIWHIDLNLKHTK